MAMRNFWVETRADGNKTTQSTGPRTKDGGFSTKVYVRDNGESRLMVRIFGLVNAVGDLELWAENDEGEQALVIQTRR
jgi:hypothetical protein